MFTLIFLALAVFIFIKLMGLMMRLAWGVGKVIFAIVFFPVVIVIAILGLAWLAIPIFLIIGLVVLLLRKTVV